MSGKERGYLYYLLSRTLYRHSCLEDANHPSLGFWLCPWLRWGDEVVGVLGKGRAEERVAVEGYRKVDLISIFSRSWRGYYVALNLDAAVK